MKIYLYDRNGVGSTNAIRMLTAMSGELEYAAVHPASTEPFLLIAHPQSSSSDKWSRMQLTNLAAANPRAAVVLVSSAPGLDNANTPSNIRWSRIEYGHIEPDQIRRLARSVEQGSVNWSIVQPPNVDALVAYYLLAKAGQIPTVQLQEAVKQELIVPVRGASSEVNLEAVSERLRHVFAPYD